MEEQQQWPPSSCPMRAAESASDATAEQIWRGIARHDGRGCCTMMSCPCTVAQGSRHVQPSAFFCFFAFGLVLLKIGNIYYGRGWASEQCVWPGSRQPADKMA
jgi:hypothetical protein